MRDGNLTRHRILDAATDEFSTYGLAGARIERIAAAARANKAQMYAYFGSKRGLFDAVLLEQFTGVVDTVKIADGDLASYAVALYDAYIQGPELVRLATWARLELVLTGDLPEYVQGHQSYKLPQIAQAQQDGLVDTAMAPVEVLALVLAIAGTWSPASGFQSASKDDDEAVHERRRFLIARVVTSTVSP